MSNDDIIIDSAILESFKQILLKNNIQNFTTVWIAHNHCVHFICDVTQNLKQLQALFGEFLYPQSIDIAVLPYHNRQKKLLISDMDSTMINQECIDELADFIGKKAEISAITESAMRGELNFEESLIKRVSLLKGLSVTALDKCYTQSVTFMAGSKELLSFMKKNNAYTILVSGGFTFFANKVANELGFDAYFANILNSDQNNHLTGTVALPILGRETKADILIEQAGLKNITHSDCIAVGDGANDLSMLTQAGLGIAYHAKPAVAAMADVAIHFCDLRSLIYLQS